MNKKISKLISTFFYVGYCPFAPGTAASFAAVLIYLLLWNNPVVYIITLVIVTILGFMTAKDSEAIFSRKDPPQIVIDEISGMLIALLFLPRTLPIILVAFFLFRAFDTLKPTPINRLEKLKGSLGIMLDDIAAGIYVNLSIHLALRFISFSTS